MRDFTVEMYIGLVKALKDVGYDFQTFHDFIVEPKPRVVILRHDVDKLPLNSLRFAKLEIEMGVQASFFFRIVRESFQPSIIKQIKAMGHEIGYHYEDMDLCGGNVDSAYDSFRSNLDKLRELAPIETICMHGSPLSKYDNRDIWDKYDYKADGIVGEPYFDIDYNKVLYITDTGRMWNNNESSIRDKVNSGFNFRINSTKHLIELLENDRLPSQLMINTHPQRWTDNMGMWAKELVLQNVKNQIKKIISHRSHGLHR